MTGRARSIQTSDFEEFDLILAMDRANLKDIQQRAPNQQSMEKVRLFCEFCSEHDESEVPDPYYGGAQGFELVLDLLEDGCAGILESIASEKAT